MFKQETLFDNKRTMILTLKNEYWAQMPTGEKRQSEDAKRIYDNF